MSILESEPVCMSKTIRKILFVASLVLLIFGKSVYADSLVIYIGDIIFDCHYVNFAWGYRLEGFYIDHNGNLYKYNRHGNPWLPDSVRKGDAYYPETDLLDKFQNKKLIGTIERTILEEKINLISEAARGTITRKQRGNDMGGRGCVAYYFDNNKKTYKEINLGSTGDFDEENSSDRAKELLIWLKQFWNQTQ